MTPPSQSGASRRPVRDPSPDAVRRLPRPAARPQLEVVGDGAEIRRRSRFWRRAMVAVGVLALLATPFALVLVHVELTATQLRLSRLQTRADQADIQYQKLRLEVAQLSSPARVVQTAQGLGMVTPTTITYLTASPGVPVAPAADPAGGGGAGVHGWTVIKHVDATR